ncbi:MAG: helix-turn-helix domain-containing protein [Clostridia bacterium]|nr:helix-turn-helix domain-containing protein [Clostridia bacterium]
MQANFNLKREIQNELIYGISHSPGTYIHFHSQIEIYFIRSGKVEIIINDKRKVLGADEFAVALSYDAHGYRMISESAEAMYLIIPTDYLGEILPMLTARHFESPFINHPETVKTVSDAMQSLIAGGNEVTRRGLIYLILGAILDRMTKSEQNSEQSHLFSPEILIYISEHFREDLTLSAVAGEFGYNASYLSRSFRETFGISFVKYLTMIRLREAILLLRSENKSVIECAMESGFGSMRSFYRAFHEEFGLTPKEYFATEQNKMK